MIDHTHAGTPRAHARYDLLAGDVPIIRQAVQKRIKRPLLHCNETFASLLDFLHKLITICVFFTQQKQREHFYGAFFHGIDSHSGDTSYRIIVYSKLNYKLIPIFNKVY